MELDRRELIVDSIEMIFAGLFSSAGQPSIFSIKPSTVLIYVLESGISVSSGA